MRGAAGMIYRFGDWQLDTRRAELRRAGRPLTLEPRVFDVLAYLIAHRDRTVPYTELIAHVWPGQFITDATLARCIVAARRAVGDTGRAQRCIKTLRNRGYRFVAPVEEHVDSPSDEDTQAASEPSLPMAGSTRDQGKTAAAHTPLPRQPTAPDMAERVPAPQTMPREGGIACPQCEHENSVTASFCGACGTRLVRVCPACGREADLRTLFCTACGRPLIQPLPGTSSPPPGSQWERQAGQLGQGGTSAAWQRKPEAERRHLTVLFCDVVDSTVLSVGLDPEAYREVIGAYHAACAEVIARFDGHIAQYLGDGVLVYFGYPRAHEDDAQRAVRVGLGIVEALGPLQTRLQQEQGVSLAVRVGIHTGLVVVGAIGEGARHERLALGEAPILAARLQGLAPPDTVLISAATARLVQGWFACEALGEQTLKGFPAPMPVYRVLAESGVQSRLDLVGTGGLTPLIGREHEVVLLLERWERTKEGLGQIVLLSGEAGIGKSRLVRAVQDRLAGEPYTRLECRCSPYAQHSALYPVIDLGRRLLHWQREEAPDVTLSKLEAALAPYDVSLPEVVPLLASLLSLPLSERYSLPQLTPQRQRQRTLEAILALLLAHAAQQPVLFIVEDLHWIDPSTMELLTLFIGQGPTARILTLLTCRPEFQPPRGFQAHVTSLMLDRLPPTQVELMIEGVTGGKRLPAAVRQQVVAKTDGVPLFVEELTKTVIESGLLREQADHYELPSSLPSLAIPATLHDSLMARLDRLTDAKEVAQLGATLGRTFPYELLQAVSPWGEDRLRQALDQLVEAELLYHHGVPPQLTYAFKHTLIQETAYQSLLRSQRQQYHRQTAPILEQHFPEIAETQPELLAHHYTEAGMPAQALPYWERAGQRAIERSANVEAISHFTKGLELLKALPETPERTRQELALQLAVSSPLRMTKGETAPEMEGVYTRAYELSQQVGNQRQQFSALVSLSRLYLNRARIQKARELAEQCFALAQSVQDPILLQEGHRRLGSSLFFHGELVTARVHFEQGIALCNVQQGHLRAFSDRVNPYVTCLSYLAWTLWLIGYPDQALNKICEALTLARRSSHTYSLAVALHYAAVLRLARREARLAQKLAEETVSLSRMHGFEQWSVGGIFTRGGALIEQGLVEEGIDQLRQAQAASRAMGKELAQTHIFVRLAKACLQGERVEEGLQVLTEALHVIHESGERYQEAEVYRLKGELLLQRAIRSNGVFVPSQPALVLTEAENCFRHALAVARAQQVKSLELRAAMSLSRLWQQQSKHTEAYQLLAEVYAWFTEGFETQDLQDAQILLKALV
jgi:class 3 adenylate cyclase/DNA-binding winged helix-turn-helix (wHTH) protein/tetratricopeptide (TPR) repeat protein